MDPLRLRTNAATATQIAMHLQSCNLDFIPSLDSLVDIEAYARKLASKSTRIEVWYGGEIVGLAAVYGPYAGQKGFLSSLSVIPSHRRKGIAEMLIREAERILASRGVEVVELQVGARNESARSFYGHLGYKIILSGTEMIRLAKNIEERT